MDDLITFVRARLKNDEDHAQAAINEGLGIDLGPDGELFLPDHPDAHDHVATWYPARVLRDVEAKRAIVELHTPKVATSQDWTAGLIEGTAYCHTCESVNGMVVAPCDTLRTLASAWSSHEDYDAERWAP